ncbi:hypothetical protein [Kozakia baliensis]|uniref:hypothetical protein n=1 Tax=Kozakia baliensis TaxID=153496 RepID=UPI000496F756|nr:hypothetical protein [Kozakia baliensis]
MSADNTNAPTLAKPIHVHQVNDRPVRFFLAPNGSEAFPWFAFKDLVGAAALGRDVEERFSSHAMTSPFRDDMRMQPVAGGQTLIAPLHMAQGLIGAMEEIFSIGPALDREFINALQAAVEAGYPELSDVERFQLILRMGRHHLGADDPVRRSPDLGHADEGDAA